MHRLFSALHEKAERNPNAVAVVDDRDRVSYGVLGRRIGGFARRLEGAGPVVGLLAENGVDWVVADLAIALTGRRFVPLPCFFSREQIAHICRDAEVDTVVASAFIAARLKGLPVRTMALEPKTESLFPAYWSGATRVIYTSGTTGAPKGVLHGDRQIGHMIAALTDAAGAHESDRHLSVLPLPLLLEQVAGIYVPLAAGAQVHLSARGTNAAIGGNITPMLAALSEARPTTTILTPKLLTAWLAALDAGGQPVPDTLRLVAVGGAPVPESLISRARALGIPAFQGYGLSECCSVVTLERPDHPAAGTAGAPIPGVSVRIEDGEIVVSGPSLMSGYLGGDRIGAEWRTGDTGFFDAAGNLTVTGRRDNLIVRDDGRNVSPEWVEARVLTDPAVSDAVLTLHDDGRLVLLAVIPSDDVVSDFDTRLRDLPAYARPDRVVTISPADAESLGIAGPDDRLDRKSVGRLFAPDRFAQAISDASSKPREERVSP